MPSRHYDHNDEKGWQRGLAWTLLFFNVVVEVFIVVTSVIMYRYRKVTVIRFRSPLTWLVWSLFTCMYTFSRIIWAGLPLHWYQNSRAPVHTWSSLVGNMGFNGITLCLVLRAWMSYMAYKYDQDVLKFKTAQESWVIRYKRTLGTCLRIRIL